MFTSLEEILPDHVVSKNIIDTMENNIDGIKIDSFGNTLKN